MSKKINLIVKKQKIAILDYENSRVIVRDIPEAMLDMDYEDMFEAVAKDLGINPSSTEWMRGEMELDIK